MPFLKDLRELGVALGFSGNRRGNGWAAGSIKLWQYLFIGHDGISQDIWTLKTRMEIQNAAVLDTRERLLVHLYSFEVLYKLALADYIYVDDNIYVPRPRELDTVVKELTAATRIMQTASDELSTLVTGKAKCKQTKATT